MSTVFPPAKQTLLRPSPKAAHQQGAALILALVVFSIVALLAASLSSQFLVSVRRVENQLHGQQAQAYLRGAEGLARAVLLNDSENGPDKDHISEGWLNLPQEYPMEQGAVSGLICDLQGRFNLNNLRAKGKPNNNTVEPDYTTDQAFFIRLLQVLPLEEPIELEQAKEITQAVINWVSTADIVANGLVPVEDYSDREPAYRLGHRLMQRVSELRWVDGISDAIYRALEPHVTVLPADGTLLNVNTMSGTLLRSINQDKLLEPLEEGSEESVLEQRDGDLASGDVTAVNEGFSDPEEIKTALALDPALTSMVFAVKSDYFLVQSSVVFLDKVSTQYAILDRSGGKKVKAIARGQSGLGKCNALMSAGDLANL